MTSINPASARVNTINAVSNSWLLRRGLALVCFCSLLACSGCASYFPTSETEYQHLQAKQISEGTNTSQMVPSGEDTSYEGNGTQPNVPQ